MRNVSKDERYEIEGLLGKEPDELYMLIAQTDPVYDGTLFAPEEARIKGEMSVKRLLNALRQKICVEWHYCSRRHNPDLADTVTLVAAVSDVILTIVGGIPATIISVVLVKKGLSALCECDSNAWA